MTPPFKEGEQITELRAEAGGLILAFKLAEPMIVKKCYQSPPVRIRRSPPTYASNGDHYILTFVWRGSYHVLSLCYTRNDFMKRLIDLALAIEFDPRHVGAVFQQSKEQES